MCSFRKKMAIMEDKKEKGGEKGSGGLASIAQLPSGKSSDKSATASLHLPKMPAASGGTLSPPPSSPRGSPRASPPPSDREAADRIESVSKSGKFVSRQI